MTDSDNDLGGTGGNRSKNALLSIPQREVHTPARLLSPVQNSAVHNPDGAYITPNEHAGHDNLIREYLGLIVKHRRIMTAIVISCVSVALLYALLATRWYSAESRIRISTYEPVMTSTRIEDVLQQKSREANYLETQLEELRSMSLADRVLQDPLLFEYFNGHSEKAGSDSAAAFESRAADSNSYRAPVKLIKAYLRSVSVTPIKRTSLVSIEGTATDADISARIAQLHATNYIEWVRDNRLDQQTRSLTFLQKQANELRQKVADLDRAVADYAEENAIVAVNKDENIVAQRMAQLNSALSDVVTRRLEAENLAREAKQTADTASAGFDDPSTQSLRSELAKLEGEYQQLSSKFTAEYPRMQQLQAQIGGLRRTIRDQRRQIASGLEAKASALLEQERQMKEELELQKSRAFDLAKRQVKYNELNRELSSSRDLLESVLKQMKETGLAAENNASNITLVDPAVVPTHPSYPRRTIVVLLGLIVGCAIAGLVALVMSRLDSSIRTNDEVIQHLRLPTLGFVPRFDQDEDEPGSQSSSRPRLLLGGSSSRNQRSSTYSADHSAANYSAGAAVATVSSRASSGDDSLLPSVQFIDKPRSLAAEAYRAIRTSLLLSRAGDAPRTILVTSAQSGEGKTTSSVNLCASLSSSGARVILIDADLRRASVMRQFGLPSDDPGLVEVLTGQRSIEQVAVRHLMPRVTVIPAGSSPPNPAELLGSASMLSLIERLAQEYDYVVIDSPPVLPVTDSVVLSRFVEGVVFVVGSGVTPRKVLADARDRLRAVGAHILGTILNRVDLKGGEYYYYNRYYRSYYKQKDYKQRDRTESDSDETNRTGTESSS